jgi:hypothetical protein
MRNPCLAAVLEVLTEAGIHHPTIVPGGKHLQIRWQTPDGRPRMKSIATTPSDVFAPTKAGADVRRILRADGMLSVAEPRAAAPVRQPSEIERIKQRLSRIEQRLGLAETA